MSSSGSDADSTGDGYKCGYLCYRPRWLQVFNNIKWAVFFISLGNCIQNAANGLLGVSISTLEKRFNFSSFMSSIIASSYEFGQVPAVIFIMIYGHKIHRPLFFGAGMLSVGIGCLLFFLPQFILPAYIPSFHDENAGEKDDLCMVDNLRGNFEACLPDENRLSKYLPFFSVGRFLIGMGATPILTAGITYINDCSTKEDFALYSGIFNSMSIVGPGIGVLTSSMLLNLYVDFYRVDIKNLGFDDEDPRWIGNWWMGYVALFLMSLVSAIPLFGFPNDLPGAKEIRELRVIEEREEVKTNPGSSVTLLVKIKKLLKNLPFMITCAFSACEMFIIIGFNSFGPKIFENLLVVPPHVSGIVFGLVLLPSGMVGTILGGLIIQRFKLGCKKIILVQTVFSIIALLLLPTILLTCPSPMFAGANAPIGHSSYKMSMHDTCNEPCMCGSTDYRPICDNNGIQYFSPCHAGCKSKVYSEKSKTFEFFNCSCVSAYIHSEPDAYSSPCETTSCENAMVFLWCFSVVVCIMFICFTMNLSAMLRVVKPSQATAAVSLQVLVTKVLGTIPAPLLFGMCIDMSCALWESAPCDLGESKCVFFFTKSMSRNILLICFVPKIIGCLSMIILNIAYKPKTQKGKKLLKNVSNSQ